MMRYCIGIDIDPQGAAVALLDEAAHPVSAGADLSYVPRLCVHTRTGERLLGMRAMRYCSLHSAQPDVPGYREFFACIAQSLRDLLSCAELPPVVLSCHTVDPNIQRGFAQAAHEAGLHVLRVLNRAAACIVNYTAGRAEEWEHVLYIHNNAAGTVLYAEASYGDSAAEILTCAEYTAQTPLPTSGAPIHLADDGSTQDVRAAAAFGAAVFAAVLQHLPAVPDYLLLDALGHGVYLNTRSGQPISFLAQDTCYPVRKCIRVSAQDVCDADGCVHYAFFDNPNARRSYITLQSDAMKTCTELELTLTIDANRTITLTARDMQSGTAEAFELLRSINAQPPHAAAGTQQQPDAAHMLDALLHAMDSLENGLRMLTEEERASSIGQGMLLIHKQFSAALRDMGIEPIPAEGCLFDPRVHEAMVTMPHEQPGWVLQEYRRGYRKGSTLLRAAQVMVSE